MIALENKEPIHILFERYLADACSSEEVRELLAYFNVTEDHEQLRMLINDHFEALEPVNESNSEALREVHEQLLAKVKHGDSHISGPSSFFLSMRWLRMAAVWVLLALGGGAAIYFGSRWANHAGSSQLAAEILEQTQTEQTGIGERKKVILEDGSVVWLNAQSSLTYPKSFKEDSREVSLEGEGYFEIFRDTARPFTIRTGVVETKVLGTSFNIKAYQTDRSVAVSVVTGKVAVNTAESSVQIIENQQVNYADGKLHKEINIDAKAQMSWRTGKMQFRNTALSEVIKTLQRNYPLQITYPESVKDCPVHADFDEDTPAESVMEMLAVSLRGKLTKQGNGQYYLDGNCKSAPAHLSQ